MGGCFSSGETHERSSTAGGHSHRSGHSRQSAHSRYRRKSGTTRRSSAANDADSRGRRLAIPQIHHWAPSTSPEPWEPPHGDYSTFHSPRQIESQPYHNRWELDGVNRGPAPSSNPKKKKRHTESHDDGEEGRSWET